MSKLEDLKSPIKAQLSDNLVDRFNVGYVQNKVVSLRSKEDIRDLMGSVQKGDNILLWCDGLHKERVLCVNAKASNHRQLTALTQMMILLPNIR